MPIATGAIVRWFAGRGLRTRAGIVAVVVAVVLMSGQLLAESCWDRWLKDSNEAPQKYSQCLRDIDSRIAGADSWWEMWTHALMEKLTWQREMCEMAYLSDIAQANTSYASCMSIEAIIGVIK